MDLCEFSVRFFLGLSEDSLQMEQLDESIQDILSSVSESLSKTSEVLSSLTTVSYEDAQEVLTDPEARARFHATIAFALNSLYFIYVRCSGQIPQDHPIQKEISRVRHYFNKIKQAYQPEPETTPTKKLDVDAAGRFIRHALSANDSTETNEEEIGRLPERTHIRFTSSNARSTVAPSTNNVLWQQLQATSATTEEMVDKFLQKKRKSQR